MLKSKGEENKPLQESPRRGGEPREAINPVSLREDGTGATVENMSLPQCNYVERELWKSPW